MMQEENSRDLAPDPDLQAALRSLAGEPPVETVDWERLRRSIGERAELPLARRRTQEAERGRHRVRLRRPLLPLAAAASVVLAIWMGGGEGEPAGTAPETQLSAEELFRPELTEQEFSRLVSGGEDPAALLLIALEER